MDEDEARELLDSALSPLRSVHYDDLVRRFVDSNEPEVTEIRGSSGVTYQIEVEGFWDDKRTGNVRVVAMIDDGGWRAVKPLTEAFIKAPDGSFVGE